MATVTNYSPSNGLELRKNLPLQIGRLPPTGNRAFRRGIRLLRQWLARRQAPRPGEDAIPRQ